MPSGHSAVAFSIWTLIALISQNALVVFTVFILSFLVAQSRVGRHYHSIWEVFIGAAIGITVTLMIYRMLAG
jgi:diacylglycerol kinase (ATP)